MTDGVSRMDVEEDDADVDIDDDADMGMNAGLVPNADADADAVFVANEHGTASASASASAASSSSSSSSSSVVLPMKLTGSAAMSALFLSEFSRGTRNTKLEEGGGGGGGGDGGQTAASDSDATASVKRRRDHKRPNAETAAVRAKRREEEEKAVRDASIEAIAMKAEMKTRVASAPSTGPSMALLQRCRDSADVSTLSSKSGGRFVDTRLNRRHHEIASDPNNYGVAPRLEAMIAYFNSRLPMVRHELYEGVLGDDSNLERAIRENVVDIPEWKFQDLQFLFAESGSFPVTRRFNPLLSEAERLAKPGASDVVVMRSFPPCALQTRDGSSICRATQQPWDGMPVEMKRHPHMVWMHPYEYREFIKTGDVTELVESRRVSTLKQVSARTCLFCYLFHLQSLVLSAGSRIPGLHLSSIASRIFFRVSVNQLDGLRSANVMQPGETRGGGGAGGSSKSSGGGGGGGGGGGAKTGGGMRYEGLPVPVPKMESATTQAKEDTPDDGKLSSERRCRWYIDISRWRFVARHEDVSRVATTRVAVTMTRDTYQNAMKYRHETDRKLQDHIDRFPNSDMADKRERAKLTGMSEIGHLRLALMNRIAAASKPSVPDPVLEASASASASAPAPEPAIASNSNEFDGATLNF